VWLLWSRYDVVRTLQSSRLIYLAMSKEGCWLQVHLAYYMFAVWCRARGVPPFLQFLHLITNTDWSRCHSPRWTARATWSISLHLRNQVWTLHSVNIFRLGFGASFLSYCHVPLILSFLNFPPSLSCSSLPLQTLPSFPSIPLMSYHLLFSSWKYGCLGWLLRWLPSWNTNSVLAPTRPKPKL